MTVVNPKSISGINSITTGSGSDNLLTIHTSDANNTERLRIDSTGATKIVTGIVTTLTATGSAKVGTGITLSSDGDIFTTGISTFGGNSTFSTSGGDDAVVIKGDTYTALKIQSARDSSDSKAFVQMHGSRGTNASPTIIQNGDIVGTINARAYDGNSYASMSDINFEVDGAPGDGDMPGRIVFKTSADGSQSPSERARITSAGLVGIGTDNPLNGLDVNQSEGRLRVNRYSHLLMQNTNDSHTDYWGISARNGGELDIGYGTPDGSTSIIAGDMITIASDGKVGVNCTPTAKLEVRDASSTGIIVRCTNTQSTHTNKAIRIRNNSDTDVFSVSHLGNIFISNGQGIDFSDTGNSSGSMSSELLDDYEEGTFTPTLGWSLTPTTATGRYTKIGRLVTYTIQLVWPTTNNLNYALFGSLPFDAIDGGNAGGGFIRYTDYSGGSDLTFHQNNDATITLYQDSGSTITNQALSGKRFDLVGFYYV